MHPLDSWLQTHNKSREWLAAQIGTTQATLSRLVKGKQWPSRDLAERIREITDGFVTPNDFLCINSVPTSPKDAGTVVS